MLSVIELGWNQFIVRVWDVIDVKKLSKQVGETWSTQAMLLADEDGKNVKVWTPFVEGSKVEYKVLEQYKWEKVKVFKMKAKKRYVRNRWFRPHLTKIEILNIA